MLLTNKNKFSLWIMFVIALIPFLIFTYFILNPEIPLGHQWHYYVSPFAQFFFFMIGMGIGSIKSPPAVLVKYSPYLSILTLILIILYPVQGEPIKLTSGNERVIFSILTTLLCYFIYITDFSFLHSFLQKLLATLGEISYSIYLLHPVIFALLKLSIHPVLFREQLLVILLTILITPVLSYLVYYYFEKYFMNLSNLKTKNPADILVSEPGFRG